MFYTNGSFEICQERMFVMQCRTHGWGIYLLSKKMFMLKQKSSNFYMIGLNSVIKFLSDCLSTLHSKPLPMKCNVTRQSATWSQQADLISALCETCAWLQEKNTMTAGKIYHGCFEMLFWPHRTSANIINICFWLLETCSKCSYFIEENIRTGAQRLAFEVKYQYIVRWPRICRGPAFCGWESFQTTGAWCVQW